MPHDLTGRSMIPLSEIVSAAEFLLLDYVPADDAGGIFDSIYVVEPYVTADGPNLILDCDLAFPAEIALSLPGVDSYTIVFGSAGVGWTAVHATLTAGPDASLVLSDLTLGLRFDPSVLRNPTTGNGAEIEMACTVSITPAGFEITDYAGLTLAESALCGTDILVVANDVRLIPDGVAFDRLSVKIPPQYLSLDAGSTLTIAIEHATIGSTGFTGRTSVPASNPPPTGTFAGFPCRIRGVEIDILENALVAARLEVDIRLEAFEQNGQEKWVALDVLFGQGGEFSAQASAVQPEASNDPASLITVEYSDAVSLGLNTLRLSRAIVNGNDRWCVYFSGYLRLLIPGATWPKVGFDHLGVSSDGELLLPEGSGIAFDSPLVVEWYFVRLTIPKFRFGRPKESATQLQVQLAAEVTLLEGLPAGVSVEGLTVRWNPQTADAPQVSFSGIGVELGVPGCFSAGIELGFTQDGESVEFRGQGHLELSALDMAIQIGVIVGYDQPQDFSYLYLFADAKLLPTGIPIGQSGLAIFGFQGLIAYNMVLALNTNLPVDERYYTLFMQGPIGITDIAKWRKENRQNALGIGVVLGTVDAGFSFNVKGLLAVAFPDLVLLLQAKANILRLKPDLSTNSAGTLDALLVYDSREQTFTFDIVARWGMPSIVEVSGSARAFFDFDDPAAFYLDIGRDESGKRVSANVIRWGNNWLFTAGFWFHLDRSGIVTGVLIEVGVRYEAGGFWIEAIGSARGEMKLFWEPAQWEGSIALSGRIGAGFRGISVGLSLTGAAKVQVARPLAVEIYAEACFKALLWRVCMGHTFRWSRLDPPQLERPIRGVAAKPRDWTARVQGQSSADDGVVQLVEAATTRRVQPHSTLVITFAKPMVDRTNQFNEAVSLPNSGYLTIGEGSGFSAAYELTGVHLVRDPDGARQTVNVWGTWAMQTPQYNTALGLLSSERFGHDGSLTEAFSDGVVIDYCGRSSDDVVCVNIAGIEPGYGWIDGRFPYQWDVSESQHRSANRRNRPFVELLSGDRLIVYLPTGYSDITMVTRECPPGGEKPPKPGDERSIPLAKRKDGAVIVNADMPICVERICFKPGHGPAEYVTGTRRGGSRTQHEDWTVSADARLLEPGATYELTIEPTGQLRHDGPNSTPVSFSWQAKFVVDAPPIYPHALNSYVAATYPSAGARPIYTGYDLVVRFHHDYVGELYKSAGQLLCVRLFDAQGRPVTDASGAPVLIPAMRTSLPDRSVSQREWERQYRLNVERGCIAEDLGMHESETTIAIDGPSIRLTPNSQYRASLVSNEALDVELYGWDFTTSSYAMFSDLVTAGRVVHHPLPFIGAVNGANFDAVVRVLGLPTIGYATAMSVLPIVSPDRALCVAMLLESPEPLEANQRLTITVDGIAADALPNVDGTRVVIRPRAGATWAAGTNVLRLTWSRGAATDPAELRRTVAGALGNETIDITVESGGL